VRTLNNKVLERLHDLWLEPPDPPDDVCDGCGSDEDVIHTFYDTYICHTCLEMQEQLEIESSLEEDC
jgi:hypothetical protein